MNVPLFLAAAGPEAERRRRNAMIRAHPALRGLIGPSPVSALVVLGLVATQLALAAWVARQGLGIALIVAVGIGALLAANLTAMIHEAAHGLIFRSARANRLAAIVANAALISPAAMPFFHYHKWHHSGMGDYRMDVGIPTLFEARWVGSSPWRKALWLAAFPVFQGLRTRKFQSREPYWTGWMAANFAAQAAVVALISYAWGWPALVYLLLSYGLSVGFHPLGTRVVQEHFVVAGGEETNNHVGPLSIFECNFGYHAEHHDFPRVAWHRLPSISRMAPEYYRETPVFRSRIFLLFSFLTDRRFDLRNHAVRGEPL